LPPSAGTDEPGGAFFGLPREVRRSIGADLKQAEVKVQVELKALKPEP
jgi:hypothetical protein